MRVVCLVWEFGRNLGKGEIVCGTDSDRAPLDKCHEDRFGAGKAVTGVRAMQEFVEEKENRQILDSEIQDIA
jgi:hypothetical protein